MTNGQIILLAAMAFTSALAGFTFAAQSRGWPQGALFSKSWPSTVAALLSVALLATALTSGLTWIWVVWTILAFFAGGPIVYMVLGANSGPVSLILSPILTLSLIYFKP